jgi:hypothetical protein
MFKPNQSDDDEILTTKSAKIKDKNFFFQFGTKNKFQATPFPLITHVPFNWDYTYSGHYYTLINKTFF